MRNVPKKSRRSPLILDDDFIFGQNEVLTPAGSPFYYDGSFLRGEFAKDFVFNVTKPPPLPPVVPAPVNNRISISRFFANNPNTEARALLIMDSSDLLELGITALEMKIVLHYTCSECSTEIHGDTLPECVLCNFCKKTLFCKRCAQMRRPDLPCLYCLPKITLLRVPESISAQGTDRRALRVGNERIEELRNRMTTIFLRRVHCRIPQQWRTRVFRASPLAYARK